ncbi:MAG: dicarboxylate/amino acid:cation symporter [Pseudomonadales bacterium]|nr:dicarboxylate/amino acid:cation symporter [Pseudomonadales bacterium]MCP5183455.1 dicarboxylate/amino acid:cation symporter [Pseudomonadales bacterium]
MSLTVKILLGMAAGLAAGVLLKAVVDPGGDLYQVLVNGVFDAGGQLFIRSLTLLVVPLVLVSLVCGAAGLGASGHMGALGVKTLVLYLTTTAVAITLALVIALLVGPGKGVHMGEMQTYESAPAPSIKDTLIDIVPKNPVASMAEGKMLQIITFALLLGIAISRAGEHGVRLRRWFEDANEVLMVLINLLVRLAPLGVFCLIAKLFSTLGWEEIRKLIEYFFTVAAVLLLHVSVVYPSLLVLLGRVHPMMFFRKMREPMIVAFSTSSSGATIPVTMRTVEQRLGVSNNVTSFVVPLGATINMDGTAIMQGVATVFIAQFYGIDLTFVQCVTVILTATLASIGTAAVPSAGLVMLAMVLTQVGLPVEGIALIIGVDRLLDMMRTAVNVSGDATVAVVVARSEGQFDETVFNTRTEDLLADASETR